MWTWSWLRRENKGNLSLRHKLRLRGRGATSKWMCNWGLKGGGLQGPVPPPPTPHPGVHPLPVPFLLTPYPILERKATFYGCSPRQRIVQRRGDRPSRAWARATSGKMYYLWAINWGENLLVGINCDGHLPFETIVYLNGPC